jgi:putative hydrolase of HD superfamily
VPLLLPLLIRDTPCASYIQEAMENFVHEMLHDSPAALKIMSLWKEYEDQSTAEARFVKGVEITRPPAPWLTSICLLTDVLDLDRFEMATQALEYERAHGSQTLQPFFDSSIPHLRHGEVREWGADLLREREGMRARGDNQRDIRAQD